MTVGKTADQHQLKLATAGVLGQVGTRAVYSGNRIDLQAVFQHALRGGLGIGLYGQGLPGFFESPGGLRCRPCRISQRQVSNRQRANRWMQRSEEHTSELQSLMRTSYAGLCL